MSAAARPNSPDVSPAGRRPLGALLLSTAKHQGGFAARLAAHPGVRLVGVAGEIDEPEWVRAGNRQLADRYGLPYTEDVPAALAQPDVDLVSVCSEYSRHARHSIAALDAGKHVLLDKQPIGLTLEEGRAVFAAAERVASLGVRFTYVHHCQDPAIVRARRVVSSGEIGTVRALFAYVVTSHGPGEAPETSPESRWGKAFHPQWWSGGELLHHGGYGIGCARYLLDQDVASVHAVAGSHFNRLHRDTDVEDLVTLSLEFTAGAVGTIVVGRIPNPAALAVGGDFVHVVGSDGVVTAGWDEPTIVVADSQVGAAKRHSATLDATARVIHSFLESTLAGTAPARDHRDGFAELRAMLAAGESLITGRPVTVVV